jgi:hypothetical protein
MENKLIDIELRKILHDYNFEEIIPFVWLVTFKEYPYSFNVYLHLRLDKSIIVSFSNIDFDEEENYRRRVEVIETKDLNKIINFLNIMK